MVGYCKSQYILLNLIFLGVLVYTAGSGTSTNSNQVMFMKMGRTSLTSSYGHLVIPLRLNDLKKAFDHFDDMHTAFAKATSSDDLFDYAQTERNRIRSKIDMLHHLALQENVRTHFLEYDDENTILDHFNTNLGDRWLKTDTTTNTNTAQGRKKRNTLEVVKTVFQLGAFGLSLFNKAEIGAIWKAAEDTESRTKYVSCLAEETLMRMNNLTIFAKESRDMMGELAKNQAVIRKSTARQTIQNGLERVTRVFTHEIQNFMVGIQALQDGRLSPLLVDQDEMRGAYEEIITKARSELLQPVTDDASVIFQTRTSVVGTGDGDLLCIVHIPLYSGQVMDLYRFTNAPFQLANGVVAQIRSDVNHLALASSGALGKELGLQEILNCQVFSSFYHCNSNNVIQKNLENLCLFAIFHQRVDDIERLCNLEIRLIRSHAIQLDGSRFRVLATEPTQLTWSCSTGKTNVETFTGVKIVHLDRNCSSAHTPEYLFTRNPTIASSSEIIPLPMLDKTSKWFKGLKEEFRGVDVETEYKLLKEELPVPITLQRFRTEIKNKKWTMFKKFFGYIQIGMTALGLLYLSYNLTKWVRSLPYDKLCCTVQIRRRVKREPIQMKIVERKYDDDVVELDRLKSRMLQRIEET